MNSIGTAEHNTDLRSIEIDQMNSPENVFDFIKAFHRGRQHGLDKFILNFSKVDRVFPNACTPIAGIIQLFSHQGITFTFKDVPEYLKRMHIQHPLSVQEHEIELKRSSLNTVWVFHNSEDLNKLVDAFVDEIATTVECKKGVLEGLSWCLNEVADNVIQHSKIDSGYIMGQIHRTSKHIAFCVFDGGQGIYNSLKDTVHAPRNPVDAITKAIKERVTRDTTIGQGNGMWGLHQIVRSNSGRLVITSCTASYMMLGNEIKTFTNLPPICKGSVTIDFQIDFEKEISIAAALGGYEPVNLRIENLEDKQGNLLYKLTEKSSGTGTRQSGERIRNEIINLHNESGKIIEIDFDGISVVSSSFADELLGKLIIRYGFFNFNQVFRLKNMNQIVQSIVHRSVSQRMADSLKAH